jgi:hypothetical protein
VTGKVTSKGSAKCDEREWQDRGSQDDVGDEDEKV